MSGLRETDRRSLLSALAGGALGVGLLGRGRSDRGPTAVRSTRKLMGTLVTVEALTASPARGERGVDAAFAEMARLTDVFSRYDPGAQVAKLNASGAVEDPAPELVSVLRTCRDVYDLTDGVFDPTVLSALSEGRAVASGGFDGVRIRGGSVRTPAPITLDGVAKGYVVDRGCAVLRRWVDEGLIEAGGDVRVFGGSAGRWRVGVADPRDDGTRSRIRLRDGAVATSGAYRIRGGVADPGSDRVVRPRTGRSPDGDASVTVVASTAERADALSTASLVLGDARAGSVLDRIGARGVVLPREGDPRRIGSWE